MRIDAPPIPRPSAPPPKLTAAEAAVQSAADNKARQIQNQFATAGWRTWEDLERAANISVPGMFKSRAFGWAAVLDFLGTYRSTALSLFKLTQAEAPKAPTDKEVQRAGRHEVALGAWSLKPQQQKAVDQTINAMWGEKPLGLHTINTMETGSGKSFVAGAIIKWLQDNGWQGHDNTFLTPRVVFITKKRVVTKIMRTFKSMGISTVGNSLMGYDVAVLSYSQLRAKSFSFCFKDIEIELFGNKVKTKQWRGTLPLLVILDESHEVKKWESKRTRYVWGFHFADHDKKLRWMSMSATPAVILRDLMLFACTAQLPFSTTETVGRENALAWLSSFGDPRQASGAAFKRFLAAIGPLHVDPPRDPRKFKAYTRIVPVQFRDERQRQWYFEAENDYIEACARIGKAVSDEGLKRSRFTILRQRKEACQAPIFADMARAKRAEGFAPIVGVFFQDTVRDVVLNWLESGIPREKICIISGLEKSVTEADIFKGAPMAHVMSRYAKAKSAKNDILFETITDWAGLRAHDIDIDTDAEFTPANTKRLLNEWMFDVPEIQDAYPDATTGELVTRLNKTLSYIKDRVRRDESRTEAAARKDLLAKHKLVALSDEEQQREIDEFQSGAREYCIFTGASGGTGLDLDHQVKTALPRWMFVTMCYYGEEFVQLLGRDYRIATISDAHHDILVFDDTIDTHVAEVLTAKVNAISAIAKRNDDLEAVLEKAIADGKIERAAVATQEQVDEEGMEDDDVGDEEE